MCDGFEQWIYRRKRDCWFLYHWSCHRSHSWSGRKWKSRKRTLASHDSIAKKNHRYVAYIALKKKKKIKKKKNYQSMFYSSCIVFQRNKTWSFCENVNAFLSFFLFHFVVLSDYRRRIQSDNIIYIIGIWYM